MTVSWTAGWDSDYDAETTCEVARLGHDLVDIVVAPLHPTTHAEDIGRQPPVAQEHPSSQGPGLGNMGYVEPGASKYGQTSAIEHKGPPTEQHEAPVGQRAGPASPSEPTNGPT